MMAMMMAMPLTPAKVKPVYVANCSGTWLKLVMALNASRTILRSGYLVSPA